MPRDGKEPNGGDAWIWGADESGVSEGASDKNPDVPLGLSGGGIGVEKGLNQEKHESVKHLPDCRKHEVSHGLESVHHIASLGSFRRRNSKYEPSAVILPARLRAGAGGNFGPSRDRTIYLFGPIFAGILGFVLFVIFGAIYNGSVKWLVGIEVEIKNID